MEMSLGNVLLTIVAVIIVLWAVVKLYFAHLGTEVIEVTPQGELTVDAQDAYSVTIGQLVEFANVGKQCGVVMDAFVRPQLPFEQYDGLDARGHAERVDCHREDDYFEAYIVQKQGYKGGADKFTMRAQVKLTARKGMTIQEAVAKMPDFTFQLIWQEFGRNPASFKQLRLTAEAEKVAALLGVQHEED